MHLQLVMTFSQSYSYLFPEKYSLDLITTVIIVTTVIVICVITYFIDCKSALPLQISSILAFILHMSKIACNHTLNINSDYTRCRRHHSSF